MVAISLLLVTAAAAVVTGYAFFRPGRCPACHTRSLRSVSCITGHSLGMQEDLVCNACAAEWVRFLRMPLQPKFSPFSEPAPVAGHPGEQTCRVVIERLYKEDSKEVWMYTLDIPAVLVPPRFRSTGSQFVLSGRYRTSPTGRLDNAQRIETSNLEICERE